MSRISRRAFLSSVLPAAAAVQIVPRHIIAASGQTPPSEKINVAIVGVGGRGWASVEGLRHENFTAFCEVDLVRGEQALRTFPNVPVYSDYRRMFDEREKEIDAVAVCTPDHTHAVISLEAIRRGKHLFCEKPLAHTVHEVRTLMKAAAEHDVVTQLGNQGHSSGDIRRFCEWVWDGAIGQVHTVHAGCNNSYSRINQLGQLNERPPVPDTLEWDLWLGPVQERAYHPMYVPGKWRGWSAFGSGIIGDWICHVVDPVFWALDLGAPETVQAEVEGYDPKQHGETFPGAVRVTYTFGSKGPRGPVTLHWYSGSKRMPRPDGLPEGQNVPDIGATVLGERGGIVYGSHGAGGLRIFPEEQMQAYKQPEPTLPRVPGHHQDFLEAIRSGKKAGSDFSYGGPLTELALLGIIGMRFPGQRLEWDSRAVRFANHPEANRWLQSAYREGWAV